MSGINMKSVGEKIRQSFSTKRFKSGASAALFTVVAFAIFIGVYILIAKLDISADITTDNKYSITDETKEMLGSMEEVVDLYYLKSADSSLEYFDRLVAQYDKYGKNINVSEVDPYLETAFIEQYTDETPEEFAILVVNRKNAKSYYIPYEKMLVIEYSLNYQTYSYDSTITGLDVEGQINSAIAYVNGVDFPVVYEITGHGETSLGSSAQAVMEKAHITGNTLQLINMDIPDDAAMLVINLPKSDYMPEEVTKLREYLLKGGKLFVNLRYDQYEASNIRGLLKDYGLDVTDGMIFEGSSRYYYGQINYIIPTVYRNDQTKGVYNTTSVIAANCAGILKETTGNADIEYTTIMSTSSTAYIKSAENSNYMEYEEGDQEGAFDLVVLAEDAATGAGIVLSASEGLYAEMFIQESSIGNNRLFSNLFVNMSHKDSEVVTVPAISLVNDEMIVVSAFDALKIGAIFMLAIPVFCIIMGIVTVVARKKK